ncbi:uncharacterized protein LOC125863874 [Solanum stenotomum]|uniref:uncharacterized protein LOC125863874 n=1 Tax=Solanum stenotomum TaxID=172797 RepID=UPI0020D0E2E6|nr:uncharacterized protein LOC125863874 [Solanum stenotomum]
MPCNSEARKIRGPTLLKDIWKLPPGKTIDVPFNSLNQSIGKEGRKLASFLRIIARTPELTPLHVDDWRNFDNEEKKKLLDFVRKKFTIPKCGEDFVLKLLGKKWKDYKCQLKGDHIPKYKTKDVLLKNRPSRIPRDQWSGLVSYWLFDKAKAENGVEPTRAEVFLLTHKKRADSRPMDDDSTKDMINEKMSNSEGPTDQPPHHVAWKGDVYSQVLGNERSGYGSRSSFGNIDQEDSSNDVVQRLEHEITKLKAKQNEEMNLMKQNQDNMQLELLQMRQLMHKYAPNECMPQNINGTSSGQVPDVNSGHGQIP